MLRQPSHFDRKVSQNQINLPNSSDISRSFTSAKSELIGFRRLAKTYSRSVSQWGEYMLTGKLARDSTVSNRSNLDFKEENTLIEQLYDSRTYKRIANHGLTLNSQFNNKVERNKKKNLTLSNIDTFDKYQKSVKLDKKRVVIIKNIPDKVSIDTVLSQIYGGPLERLLLNSNQNGNYAEVSFIKPEHAQAYYEFTKKSGFLMINGAKLSVEWADSTNSEEYNDTQHPSVTNYLLHEIHTHGCRRSLIFSQDVVGKSHYKNPKKLHYPDPRIHLSKELCFSEIKKNFSEFGELVSINPVISKKLAFSIVFADIRSSIIARRVCESKLHKMHELYGDWKIEYGKDTADRPCLSV